MKKPPNRKKIDWTYYVHWLIFWCAVAGVLGIIIQLIRYGSIVESGGIGPAGI
ncbi:MAG TPA: hypothetical protein VK149_12390 [Sideroxyarcus sp.]|nr:hypothetical protein [Sideroxyarcus sp.]